MDLYIYFLHFLDLELRLDPLFCFLHFLEDLLFFLRPPCCMVFILAIKSVSPVEAEFIEGVVIVVGVDVIPPIEEGVGVGVVVVGSVENMVDEGMVVIGATEGEGVDILYINT